MTARYVVLGILATTLLGCQTPGSKDSTSKAQKAAKLSKIKVNLVKNIRQVTYSGLRSTYGQNGANDQKMIFLSEREESNPFLQVYLKDIKTGTTKRISKGYGKVQHASISNDGKIVLFSSTHQDSRSKELQKQELEMRKSGTRKRRYSSDYDQHFDLFRISSSGRRLAKLTHTVGYDSEASFSNDGKWIAFASNRNGYLKELTKEDRANFEKDPSFLMDIYIMRSNGRDVSQLTFAPGYDGAPVFSPDGTRIVWQRVIPDSHTAEIFSMKVDGSDQKQLTTLNKISWTPAYHPSGDYIIFSTNLHGYGNFELYIVDSLGKSAPVRVSEIDGYDGEPSFSNDGQSLLWTKKIAGKTQVFTAEWNDALARKTLQLPPKTPKAKDLRTEISSADIQTIIEYLASKEMKGRMTGSIEEKIYAQSMADLFRDMGLKPGHGRSYFHDFDFISGVKLGESNSLYIDGLSKQPELDKDWRPLPQTMVGTSSASPVVFAGYGIVAPEDGELRAYNSYADLSVKDKWVVMFRYVPEDVPAKEKSHLHRYGTLSFKVMTARNRGAHGVIFVSGPSSGVKNELVPFKYDSATSESSIPIISVTDGVANSMFKKVNMDITETQKKLDSGNEMITFPIEGLSIKSSTHVIHTKAKGRNILALLRVPGAKKTTLIGAHIDHLGMGKYPTSLAKKEDVDPIHYGADDNASGVAGVLELAHYFSKNKTGLRQNILFALWSGEELGTLGSGNYVNYLKKKSKKLHPGISSYINMDMIGRYRKKLTVQGIGSSDYWPQLVENLGPKLPVSIQTQEDPYLPTDSMRFYLAGVPTLNFFTGAHQEYHTPRDKAGTINFSDTQKVIEAIRDFSRKVASRSSSPGFKRVKRTGSGRRGNSRFRIYLGTIPDYTSKKVKGVRISGVVKDGPAEKAGLIDGDVIVECGKNKIENIYDYVHSLQAMKPGKKTSIVVLRDGNKKEMDIVPSSRE